jgi:integrase
MATIYRDGEVWRGIIRRKGHKAQSFSHPKKIEVEKWARRIESSMDERLFRQPIKEPVRLLFERYRKEVTPDKRGAKWETTRIDLLLRTADFVYKPLGDLIGGDIQAWRDKRLRAVSGASVNREMNLLSAMFTHAIKEWHYPMANPVRAVKRPPKAKARNRRVAASELGAIKAHFAGCRPGSTRWYVPHTFEVSVETALRMGELCRLKWSDVHLDGRWLHVEPGKNGDARDVPLTPRAVELLGMLPAGEMVFPVNDGTLGVEFRRACKALGIHDLHFHDARHEATSRLAQKLSVLELAAVIGHRDLKSLMVYYNPTAAELAAKLGAG